MSNNVRNKAKQKAKRAKKKSPPVRRWPPKLTADDRVALRTFALNEQLLYELETGELPITDPDEELRRLRAAAARFELPLDVVRQSYAQLLDESPHRDASGTT